MTLRRQLPVASRVEASAIRSAAVAAFAHDAREPTALMRELRSIYDAQRSALTDSGTSALVAALRLTAGKNATVAYPGYACVDLAAAARFAGVRVRLYDIDPETLSPDLDSLAAALERGVDAVVVAHLYGFPADMHGVEELARTSGVPVIEDAAQGAGGTLGDRVLGSFGALSILSFGRGKGTTGGNGGALLLRDASLADKFSEMRRKLGRRPAGVGDLVGIGAQWLLGRPSLYGIPSAIPSLHLGEMVYHPAHEPRALSWAAASLVRRALAMAPGDVAARRRTAAALEMATLEGADIRPVRPIEHAVSGYLRYPILDSGSRAERADMGILRGYKLTLHEQQELRPCLVPGEPPTPGAEELARSLFTLPTHYMVKPSDIKAMMEWLRVPTRLLVPIHGRERAPRAARSH
jgi:dTDP-4-amino-4,6-dideoxygalactose transaminase